MISYGDFIDFAAVETAKRVKLSANSYTLFCSVFQWLRNPHEWEHDGEPLTEVEEDYRDQAVSDALYELEASNVDIGIIFPYMTASPPTGALPCDGSTHLRTAYPELYAALASAFIVDADHFITPDLRSRAPIGAGTGTGLSTYLVGANGGQESHALTTGELASHTHTVTDPGHTHVLTDPGHIHSLSDPGHTHVLTDPGHIHSLSDPGHSHTISDPGHGHSTNNPTHTHGLTDPGHIHTVTDPGHLHTGARAASNQLVADGTAKTVPTAAATNTGSNTTGVSVDSHTTGASVNAAAANQTVNNASTGITGTAASTTGASASTHSTGITEASQVTGASVNSHSTGITEASQVTGITNANAGSGTAHENRQPYLALNFAVWAQ